MILIVCGIKTITYKKNITPANRRLWVHCVSISQTKSFLFLRLHLGSSQTILFVFEFFKSLWSKCQRYKCCTINHSSASLLFIIEFIMVHLFAPVVRPSLRMSISLINSLRVYNKLLSSSDLVSRGNEKLVRIIKKRTSA